MADQDAVLRGFYEHPDVRWHEDGTVSVRLSRPIERRGERVEAVHLRRVRVKDMRGVDLRKLDEGLVEALTVLISRLSGLSLDEVGEMEFADFDLIAPQLRRLQTRDPAQSERAVG